MTGDLLSVRQVAERLGWNRRETLERLQALHAEHGGILFRRRGGRTKFWVDAQALRRVWPNRFAATPTAEDIRILHARCDHAIELGERALRQIGDKRRDGRPAPNPDNS